MLKGCWIQQLNQALTCSNRVALLSLIFSYSNAITESTLEQIGVEETGLWNVSATINPSKVALLLETRPQNLLAPLILSYASIVPPDWQFHFMGSDASIAFIHSIPSMKRLIDSGKMITSYLPSNVTTNSQESLSAWFTDPWLYNGLLPHVEVMLVFQNDAMMCSNSLRSMNDFAHYTWVGAPWAERELGGNGGLSIRNIGAVRSLLTKTTRAPGTELEDLWFVKGFEAHHMLEHFAPRAVAASFSAEMVYSWHPLGYHVGGSGSLLWGGVWGTPSLRQELYDWCPEVKMLVDMDVADFVGPECPQTANW